MIQNESSFDSAVASGLEAIERIRGRTARPARPVFVEVMGDTLDAIARETAADGDVLVLKAAGGIDSVCAHIGRGFPDSAAGSIIVVAEGDAFTIAKQVWMRLRCDYRVHVLGHFQRGGATADESSRKSCPAFLQDGSRQSDRSLLEPTGPSAR